MSVSGKKPEEDKKKWLVGFVCLVAVAVSIFSIVRQLPARSKAATAPGGGYPGGGRQMPGTRGQITTVSASAITIQTRDGAAKSFTITPATKITVDQAAVAATDLKTGQRARVVSTDNTTATEIHIRTRPFGGRGGYPGGPPPPGAAGAPS